ncbi:hypothetical protein A1Q2_03611 [Trichosporon asahii var. asahii CBS 8904]|uniref:Pheromone-processing carboxypeptidase KEX1 n=1 Tax=Trichosporon asahii var. asahii (strain CBS 8904) TaxID=1220162 RepID=K1WLE3_TRIAC|nr:hypothetical protein A1Q2_03611 [Trichosporon asahii var. asahii CBS 8904]
MMNRRDERDPKKKQQGGKKEDDFQQPKLPTAAELYVESLPGIPNMAAHPTHPLNVYAGEIPSYPGPGKGGGDGQVGVDADIFFLMVRARRQAGKQRVIFWFNGGPGCSSFDGALMEVGPFRTVPDKDTVSRLVEVKITEGGWEEYATIVFVDQPPGTGLSYVPAGGYLTELTEAGQHFVQFLKNLYQIFPDLENQDYIPYIADAILNADLPKMHLKGLAIGNGWVDPLNQYPAYAEFAYQKGLIKKGTPEGKELDLAVGSCVETMKQYEDPLKTPVHIDGCESVVMSRVTDPVDGQKMCMNIYDVRLVDTWPECGMNWPPDVSDVQSFLRRPDVVKALHATKHEQPYRECNGQVSVRLRNRNSPASVHLLPSILERGVKIMMFAGAEDLICNHVGVERTIENLVWLGERGWGANTTTLPWSMNGTQVGEWTEDRNMTYVKVNGASHMVGFDVPAVTNDMIMRFMGVDIKELGGPTGEVDSKVGDDERPALHYGAYPETVGIPLLKGGKSDWESWYNAISAVLILLTLFGIVGAYLYLRRRRLRRQLAARGGRVSSLEDEEERVPLATYDGETYRDENGRVDRKGKGKARESFDEEVSEHVLAHSRRESRGSAHSSSRRGSGSGSQTVFALGDEEEDNK